jgi:putative membrane protein
MPLPRADLLAIERTFLANERTFLAYFRTAVAMAASGLAVLNIDFFAKMRDFAHFLLLGTPLVLAIGVWRYVAVKRKILRIVAEPADAPET